jgi:hypothetical protein
MKSIGMGLAGRIVSTSLVRKMLRDCKDDINIGGRIILK